MRTEDIFPAMTNQMGKFWDQPERHEILIDTANALMTPGTFLKLHDYSNSQPTGVYPGKMWRRRFVRKIENGPETIFGESGWLLCWFGPWFNHPTRGACVTNHTRKILLA